MYNICPSPLKKTPKYIERVGKRWEGCWCGWGVSFFFMHSGLQGGTGAYLKKIPTFFFNSGLQRRGKKHLNFLSYEKKVVGLLSHSAVCKIRDLLVKRKVFQIIKILDKQTETDCTSNTYQSGRPFVHSYVANL